MSITKQILLAEGVFLLMLAFLGAVGIIGPGPEHSIFREQWWMDSTQNIIHLAVGLFCVLGGLFFKASAAEPAAWALGGIAVILSVTSIFVQRLFGVNIERPVETVLYFTLGDLNLWAAVRELRSGLLKERQKINDIRAKINNPGL